MTDKHDMKNRYAFVLPNGVWNEVTWGSNFDNRFWVVSDLPLTNQQLVVVMERMGILFGYENVESMRPLTKFGKAVMVIETKW